MERYDKLYAKIDEVFRGTPNTPSALAIKSEIIENLTIKYDEMLAEGIGEHQAVERVVDTIGDLDELFGTKKVNSPAGEASAEMNSTTANEKPRYRTLTPEEEDRLWKRKKMRAFAVVLYILSIVPVSFIGPFTGTMMASLAAMWIMWAGATMLMIGAGAYTPGADAKKRWLIGGGVGMYIVAFAPMFLLNFHWMGYVLMFVCWALATAMIILGASRKSSTVKINYKKEAHDGLDNETRSIYKRITTIVALITTAIYLWYSFLTGGWVYTWLIWIIYGCVCDIVKALLVLNARKGDK